MEQRAKHQQLRDRILAEVTATMTPNDMLPTERQLAERFEVSRMTVRQALNSLRADGVLRSVRGVGTFVARPRLSKGPALTSFSEDLAARGYEPGTELIAAEETAAETRVAVDLGVPPGARIYRIERLRLADGIPLCHEEVCLHAPRFPGLLSEDLTHSLYGVLESKYEVRLRRAQQQVRAVNVGDEHARLLGVEPNSAGLHVTRISMDETGRIVERGQSLCRGDLYDFSFVVTRPTS
ncbi:GntR family transcriptional regulator [Halostreptopolyspora alba]|uniref:GntR family transcriptional regulator n=1 Tax=Halostreptopolyspora alba TaxID=2487137 RepID=A0A3N0EBU5_9ACTN|nr:GntR family transcriptional regulator [Nocardiopsaceae bacterium YIM 96095]